MEDTKNLKKKKLIILWILSITAALYFFWKEWDGTKN